MKKIAVGTLAVGLALAGAWLIREGYARHAELLRHRYTTR